MLPPSLERKLDELLDILEAIEVRVYKLRGTNPIADIYWLSSEVAEWDLPAEEVKRRLIDFNEKFMNNYNFKNYLTANIYTNGSVKYILSEYSNDNLPIDYYNNLQVEHIFSKEPNFDPISYGFSDDYGYEKNRIGNLTLLEQELNSGLSNVAPINKVDVYLRSRISATNLLAGAIQQGNYSKIHVDDRREKIIEFCLERFKL